MISSTQPQFLPFPKISGKPADFVKTLRGLRDIGRLPEQVNLEGTVKLHGMHVDLVFDLSHLDKATSTALSYQDQLEVADSVIKGEERNVKQCWPEPSTPSGYGNSTFDTTLSAAQAAVESLSMSDTRVCEDSRRKTLMTDRVVEYDSETGHTTSVPPSNIKSYSQMECAVSSNANTGNVLDHPDQTKMHFQTRNTIICPSASTNGFPEILTHSSRVGALPCLRDRFIATFRSSNPNLAIDTIKPLVLASEWTGPKVQNSCAINSLAHRLTLYGININGFWQDFTAYADIEAIEAGIYTILRTVTYRTRMDTGDLTTKNPVFMEMQDLADSVEHECPFTALFGIRGQGEGIVWKLATPEGFSTPTCWLKTKGPVMGPENRITAPRMALEQLNHQTYRDACERWVSERRVQQGFEYLIEIDIDWESKQAVKAFSSWVYRDVFLEEADEVEAFVRGAVKTPGDIKKKVEWLAKGKYIEALRRNGLVNPTRRRQRDIIGPDEQRF